MKKTILVAMTLVLTGCQPLSTPFTPEPSSSAVIKSVEKLKRNTYRVELQGPATPAEIRAWRKEVIAMCHDWVRPYQFSVDLEKASENSISFMCETVKYPVSPYYTE